ncbi:ABC transporter permease, partial [Chloroflexota bacterium]
MDTLIYFVLRREVILTLGVGLIYVIFGSFSEFWWAPSNMLAVIWSFTPLAFLGVGQTVVVISGGFDLSVGSLYGLSATVGSLLSHGELSFAVVLMGVLVLGVAVGLINGLLVVKLGIPSFVATFGMLAILRSLMYVINNVTGVWNFPIHFS